MKLLFLIIVFVPLLSFADESESNAENHRSLASEMDALKQKVQSLEARSGSDVDQEKGRQMMDTIKRGREYQEAQQKALQELDEEE